ncbi:MAG: B12-binding domain-containing radical SAM protein, partial [Planctomycetota bacterium]
MPQVQTPAQYLGGERNSVVKARESLKGRVCLATPDAYTIGMSNHGLQVLYDAVNRRADWACERVFAPWPDMERLLREHDVPLYSLETFTPLFEFDIVGFTLQYDLGYSNVLTILDLGRIPLHVTARRLDDPLIIAGGPCAENPEPMADFIDAFVIGDGEETLPAVADAWLEIRASAGSRSEALQALAARFPWLYVPSCYALEEHDGRLIPTARDDTIPQAVRPAVVADLDGIPLPPAPIVPLIRTVQD